ncbi:sulfotransferase family protein [Nocardia suismassiliense]|uniref:sulfotransferase family protein n=1 Tax=Nocardia suismassiliense TaxID=2077092 RepID=UPI000D1EAE51|nr:sulfotransferase [Nocardia suismassiliense]
MTDTIRIRDLMDPVLSPVQRAALEAAAAHPVDLTVDAVLDSARRRTGLSDFGEHDFRDRLGLWLAEAGADANRTALGRAQVFRLVTRYATTRLKLVDLFARHPEIADEPLAAPIVVVGLPRSGTTHLVNLLAADPACQSLPLWESYEPVGPQHERLPASRDDRRARALAEYERSVLLLPHQQAMHPMEPDHVHEEIELQGPDFGGYMLEWVAHVPGWRDAYLAEDQTPRYRWMRRTLQAIQWMRGDRRRWVLKSPQHLEQLGPLLATFPDATVVVTHRDPLSVVQSAATMIAYSARLSTQRVDPRAIFGYWTDRIERMLSTSVRDRPLLPAGRTVDVYFHEFMADELGTLARIYATAGLDFATQRAAAQRYLDEHPRDRGGRIAYDLRADFDADPAVVRQRFDFYARTYPVREEVR